QLAGRDPSGDPGRHPDWAYYLPRQDVCDEAEQQYEQPAGGGQPLPDEVERRLFLVEREEVVELVTPDAGSDDQPLCRPTVIENRRVPVGIGRLRALPDLADEVRQACDRLELDGPRREDRAFRSAAGGHH